MDFIFLHFFYLFLQLPTLRETLSHKIEKTVIKPLKWKTICDIVKTSHKNHFITFVVLIQRRNTVKNANATKIKYPFSNQLIFALVMENENLCKELLERIFQGQHIKEVKILDRVSTKSEASIVTGVTSKSVRMDVLFEDKTSWFNIERQVENRKDLPFRSRYYSAALDVKNLKKGAEYTSLNPSYIIFICQFDYFGIDEAVYFFQRMDPQKSLPLGDDSYIIIINTRCRHKVPESLKALFDYINEGRVCTEDNFIEKVHNKVVELQQDEEVAQIMTMEEEYERRNTAARREGLEQGRAEGDAAATLRLARTMKAEGESIEKISKYTGLAAEEIEEL